MKTKGILSFVLFCLAMTASAQVQLLFFDGGRHVIDRNKKLYWMDAGEEDPCFDIINYKKTGNKETFTLKCRRKNDMGSLPLIVPRSLWTATRRWNCLSLVKVQTAWRSSLER